MSTGNRGSRFSYLTNATESPKTKPPNEKGNGQKNDDDGASVGREDPNTNTDSRSSGGGEGRSHSTKRRNVASRPSSAQELTSVPKGKGRMKQERSQLNVRIPTTLKRQAAAKAVLEGKDIGEVVEELLREYLER